MFCSVWGYFFYKTKRMSVYIFLQQNFRLVQQTAFYEISITVFATYYGEVSISSYELNKNILVYFLQVVYDLNHRLQAPSVSLFYRLFVLGS